MIEFFAFKERYWSPLQLCPQAQNLLKLLKCPNITVNRDCTVWREFQIMNEIDFENFYTKPNPNKRFNPQNLIIWRVLIFGFSPREPQGARCWIFRRLLLLRLFTFPSSPIQLVTILAAIKALLLRSMPNMAKPSWTAKGHGGLMRQPRYKVEPNRISAGGRTATTDDRRRRRRRWQNPRPSPPLPSSPFSLSWNL